MPFHLISLFVSIFIAFLPPSTKYNDTNGWILAPMFYDLWSRCVFCAYNAWLLLNNYKAYPINNLMRTLFFFLYWNCLVKLQRTKYTFFLVYDCHNHCVHIFFFCKHQVNLLTFCPKLVCAVHVGTLNCCCIKRETN